MTTLARCRRPSDVVPLIVTGRASVRYYARVRRYVTGRWNGFGALYPSRRLYDYSSYDSLTGLHFVGDSYERRRGRGRSGIRIRWRTTKRGSRTLVLLPEASPSARKFSLPREHGIYGTAG
ncbi:hypothetical protein PUN28_019088 [Cardiocondyla obscurior]|uniref:Uncharacterized protein n=1 Tax=Cardiocondyla obscurior TaxID=286306 RepID=A0AAW2EFC4_9HYME